MGNFRNNANLIVHTIENGKLDKKSLIEIFLVDTDFKENEEYFRDDTIELGYENEAERVSEEIFNKFQYEKDENKKLLLMVNNIFKYSNFVASEGDFTWEIIEVGGWYIISIAYIS